MGFPNHIQSKLLSIEDLVRWRNAQRLVGNTVVFTNGCFDILHKGHVDYLNAARDLGQSLVIGVNSDASVNRLKGDPRPINSLESRLAVLAALQASTVVVSFEDDTPLSLIGTVKPDVLVKGADYTIESIVGAKEVLSWGGRVETIELTQGFSTTDSIERSRKNG